jgi:Xaa-Pro aminopeptidase
MTMTHRHRRLSILFIVALAGGVIGHSRPVERVAQGASPDGKALAGITLSEYRARRQKLMELVPEGIVLLLGKTEEEDNEVEQKFRQRSSFMYLTGVEIPGAILALIPHGYGSDGVREVLFLPPRNPARERWTGPKVGPEDAVAEFGVQRALPTSAFEAELAKMLEKTKIVYTVVPSGPSARFSREHAFIERFRDGVEVRDVRPLLAELRRIKSSAEVALLREATRITAQAHREVARALRPGMFEYELEALVLATFLKNGARRPGFPPIIGSGPNSTILHYQANRRQIAAGDLVVVDIGAEYEYYTADITRTYPASGRFTDRQRQIYALVLSAQRAAEAAVRPGHTTMRELQEIARRVMRESPLRSRDGQTLDRFFIHGLGHYVGLDVHDVGDYSKPLVPGVVITIEPGIYLPDEGLGVRIEDMYLVTETGLVKLSADIPSAPEEVERWMAGRMRR